MRLTTPSSATAEAGSGCAGLGGGSTADDSRSGSLQRMVRRCGAWYMSDWRVRPIEYGMAHVGFVLGTTSLFVAIFVHHFK